MRFTNANAFIKDRLSSKSRGRWELTPRHELRYLRHGLKDEVVLKGELLGGDNAGLNFVGTVRQNDGKIVTKIFKLTGRWNVDSKNRLGLTVKKKRGKHDELMLSGLWEVDKQNQLSYRIVQTRLKTKTKKEHRLTFRGFWELSEKHRLVYVLEKSGRTPSQKFRFRGAFQTYSILAKSGQIRYQIGIEVKGKATRQDLILFGKWKFSRDFNLRFEMKDALGRRSFTFGVEWNPRPNQKWSFLLLTRKKEPLGVEVVFSEKLLRDQGTVFLSLIKKRGEHRLESGLSLKW